MFAVGVGNHPNTFLLEEMGRAGRGFTRVLNPNESNEALIDESVEKLQTPVLTDVSVDWGELDVEQVTPQNPPDVFAGGTVRIHGKYGEPGAHEITVRGKAAGGQSMEIPLSIELPETSSDGESVKLAWARQRIADYMHLLETPDQLRETNMDDSQLKEEIVELGLKHDLTTQWTSFVAVDDLGPVAQPEESEPDVKPAPRKRRVRLNKSASSKGLGGVGVFIGGSSRSGGGRATSERSIGLSNIGSKGRGGSGYGKGRGRAKCR